jgi:hypothetical protein
MANWLSLLIQFVIVAFLITFLIVTLTKRKSAEGGCDCKESTFMGTFVTVCVVNALTMLFYKLTDPVMTKVSGNFATSGRRGGRRG